MTTGNAITDVIRAFQVKAFVVVQHSEETNQLRLLGRITQDPLGVNINNWILAVRELLVAANGPWKVDISKNFVLLDGKLRFGWRLIFQAENIKGHYGSIIKTLSGAPVSSKREVTEFPLGPANRNEPRKPGGRGVQGVNPHGMR